MLEKQQDQVRFTLLDRALDKIGINGTDRIIAIKDAFKFIIENICPIEAKGLFSCFTNVTLEDWETAFKQKLNKKEKKEYLKSVEEYDPYFVEIMVNTNYSESMVKYWMN